MKQLEQELQNRAESFVALVAKEQQRTKHKQELALRTFLEASYSKDASMAIAFLLHYADEAIVRQFSYNYLYPAPPTHEMKAEIVVRPIPKEMKMTGNTGYYLIYLCQPDGTEARLKFTNKSATVYYLMYLIDRYKKDGCLVPLSLQKNRGRFVELFCRVYDISREKAMKTCDSMIRRYVDDKIRAGRENDVIYDIRRHLEAAFNLCGEGYQPYVMSARNHLSVSPHKIRFVGDAEKLLQYNFA